MTMTSSMSKTNSLLPAPASDQPSSLESCPSIRLSVCCVVSRSQRKRVCARVCVCFHLFWVLIVKCRPQTRAYIASVLLVLFSGTPLAINAWVQLQTVLNLYIYIYIHSHTCTNVWHAFSGLSQRNNKGFCGLGSNIAITTMAHSSAFEQQSFCG